MMQSPTRGGVALFLALSLAACGGGDSPAGPAQNADLSGAWRFSWNNMNALVQGFAISCSVPSADFLITQSQGTFAGVQQDTGQMLCSMNGAAADPQAFEGETLVSGTIDGDSVTFQMGTIPGPHIGAVVSGSITGTALWSLDLGGGFVVQLDGEFTAEKI